jgi:4-aminobutyrate aminotransferase-like enzyme
MKIQMVIYLWIASKAIIDYIENIIFKTTTPVEDVAEIVVEAVQEVGGYFPAPQNFLKELPFICDENGILLIVELVQI